MAGGRGVRDVEHDALDHPVLRARAREADGTLAYRGVLRHGHWLVDDHLLDGRPLLVGTAHLQLAATAFAEHDAGPGAIELIGVAHQRPLFPDARGTEIEVRFVRTARRRALHAALAGARLARRRGSSNTTGEVRRIATRRRAFRTRRPRSTSFDGLPDVPFGGERLRGGPRWSGRAGRSSATARAWHLIELPDAFADDLDVFDLHPAPARRRGLVRDARLAGRSSSRTPTTRCACTRRSSARSW